MISELTIENFRGFTSLELKDLKRVNLVVGENNSGKTSLLEAVFLLCEPARVTELPGLFRAKQGDPEQRYFRWLLRDGAKVCWSDLAAKADKDEQNVRLCPAGFQTVEMSLKFLEVLSKGPTIWLWSRSPRVSRACGVISDQHRDPDAVVALVAHAQQKPDGEENLQRLLAAVDQRIRKVRAVPGEDADQLIVDIGLSELVPVSQAGQGVYRLVAILAEIIGESPDVVLIDEVENGLHHSIHRRIWAGLAETAEKLNVQIFATTHSGECLRAAHDVFLDRPTYDFAVIQLFRVESGVQGRVLDREHIEAAIEGNIDLR